MEHSYYLLSVKVNFTEPNCIWRVLMANLIVSLFWQSLYVISYCHMILKIALISNFQMYGKFENIISSFKIGFNIVPYKPEFG